ncbi:hypothetical protein CsSME_00001325 [Camellia sinensis var. sinensis]
MEAASDSGSPNKKICSDSNKSSGGEEGRLQNLVNNFIIEYEMALIFDLLWGDRDLNYKGISQEVVLQQPPPTP